MSESELEQYERHRGEPPQYDGAEEEATAVEEINRLYESVCKGLAKMIEELDELGDHPASAELTLRLEQLENLELPQ